MDSLIIEILPATSVLIALAFLVSLGSSLLLIPRIIGLSKRFSIFIDFPDARRTHKTPTPRCGGIAIFCSLFLSLAVVYAFLPAYSGAGGRFDMAHISAFAWAALLIFAVGLIDDYCGLSWSTKLCGQIGAALLLARSGISVGDIVTIELPVWLEVTATVFWYVGLINAFNLIDGLDGLASGLAITGALGLAVTATLGGQPIDLMIYSAFIGSCLGFLLFNFHPAKIFLGDSGSMLLGLTLATFGLVAGAKTTTITSLLLPLLAMGVPVFDTLLAIWRRTARAMLFAGNRDKVFGVASADLDHIHHRLQRLGLTQRKVALLMYGASFALVTVGVLAAVFNTYASAILFISFIFGTYVVVRHVARSELWDSGLLLIEGLSRPKVQQFVHIVAPAIDLAFLTLALLCAVAAKGGPPEEVKASLRFLLPFWVGIPFLAVIAAGGYSRVWSRARVSEFLLLGTALAVSVGLGRMAALSLEQDVLTTVPEAVVMGSLAIILCVGIRGLPRSIRDVLAAMQTRERQDQSKLSRELVYGAGPRAELYLRERSLSAYSNADSRIVGLVDDDGNLRKRIVHGLKVVGTGLEIPIVAPRLGIGRITLACDLTPQQQFRLLEFCSTNGIELREWSLENRLLVPGSTPIHHEARFAPSVRFGT